MQRTGHCVWFDVPCLQSHLHSPQLKTRERKKALPMAWESEGGSASRVGLMKSREMSAHQLAQCGNKSVTSALGSKGLGLDS